jgi:hypothetical protein
MFCPNRFAPSSVRNRPTGLTGSKKRQRGAETVELALTLVAFFIVFFMLVDYSVTMFDRGTFINATRVAARQGSLYWTDPDPNVYDPTQPLDNVRVKKSMIDTALSYYRAALITPGNDTVTSTCTLDDDTDCPSLMVGMGGRSLTVDLRYPDDSQHSFIGLTGLLGVWAPNLQAQTGANAELDL